MVDEDLTEPAADPPEPASWLSIGFPFVIFGVVFSTIICLIPSRKVLKPLATVAALSSPVPAAEPTVTPQPAKIPATPTRIPTAKPTPVATPKPKKKEKPRTKKEDSSIKVDRDMEMIRREYNRFTPSSFSGIREALAKRYDSSSDRDELGLMYADVHSYLGQRKNKKAWLVKGKQAAYEWQAKHPKDARASRAVAMAHWASGDDTQTISTAKKAYDLNPGDPIARFLLGVAYFGTSNEPEGLELLKDTFAKYPECFPAGDALAKLYVARSQYTEAEPILKKLLSLERNDPGLESLLAETLEGAGKWQEIIARYEPIVQKRPGQSELKLLLSEAYRRTDRFKEANRYLNDLMTAEQNGKLKLSPTKESIYYQERGKLEFDQEKYGSSIAHFQRSLSLDPSNSATLKFLAGAQFRTKQYKESAATYDRAVKADPDDMATRQYHGMALLENGETDKAEQVFQDILKRGAETAPVYYYLARVHQAHGDKAGALAMAQKAAEIDPDYQNAKVLLSNLKAE